MSIETPINFSACTPDDLIKYLVGLDQSPRPLGESDPAYWSNYLASLRQNGLPDSLLASISNLPPGTTDLLSHASGDPLAVAAMTVYLSLQITRRVAERGSIPPNLEDYAGRISIPALNNKKHFITFLEGGRQWISEMADRHEGSLNLNGLDLAIEDACGDMVLTAPPFGRHLLKTRDVIKDDVLIQMGIQLV